MGKLEEPEEKAKKGETRFKKGKRANDSRCPSAERRNDPRGSKTYR